MRHSTRTTAVLLGLTILTVGCGAQQGPGEQFNNQQRSIQCSAMPEDSDAYDEWGCEDFED